MKVGLKETLSLLAAGYKKKDIESMIAAEEEENKEKETPAENSAAAAPAPEDKKAQDDAADKESNPEPDPKELLEKMQKELDETREKLKKLQQENIHKNSAPDAEDAKKAEVNALSDLVRSFM